MSSIENNSGTTHGRHPHWGTSGRGDRRSQDRTWREGEGVDGG